MNRLSAISFSVFLTSCAVGNDYAFFQRNDVGVSSVNAANQCAYEDHLKNSGTGAFPVNLLFGMPSQTYLLCMKRFGYEYEPAPTRKPNPLKVAFKYWENKDYTPALENFLIAANEGNSDAQFMVGMIYEDGYGVQKDGPKSALWYEKSANQGNMYSQFNIGSIHYYGKYGFEKNQLKGFEWQIKSAKQGYAPAQHVVAYAYLYGEGVNKDYAEGLSWLKKSVLQNEPRALYLMSVVQFSGIGVKVDYAKSYYFATIAKKSNPSLKGTDELISYVSKKMTDDDYKNFGDYENSCSKKIENCF